MSGTDLGTDLGIDLGIDGIGPASLIGSGGVGDVYRARQEALNRTVAVKVLRARAEGERDQQRFEEECRTMASLSRHPHLVAVYAAGTTSSGQPYLSMEHLPRGSLAERLARDGPLDPDEVIDLGIKVAGALAAAHRAGIVHRHLKPENVMLAANGEPQVADLGLGPFGPPTAGGAGGDAVSAHAAPEVFAGQKPDARSDVYSLGSVLCALLAGSAPFEHPDEESFHPLLDRVFVEEVSELRPPGVPPSLWQVIERALANDREMRTPSAAVLADQLEEVKKERGARSAAAPPRRRPPPPDVARPVAASGSRARVAAVAGLVIVAVVVGAVALTRPGSRPTSLSASDLRVATTLARSDPDPNQIVLRRPREEPFAPVVPSVPTTVPGVAPAPPRVTQPPPTVPPATPPPPTPVPTSIAAPPPPPPPPPPQPTTVTGAVIGCDSYGLRCDDVPVYAALPPPDTDPRAVATLVTVTQGTEMRARCWAEGATTANYDASEDPPDIGPDPYESDVYFNVQVLGETWGWISDTSFVRDRGLKLGLPRC